MASKSKGKVYRDSNGKVHKWNYILLIVAKALDLKSGDGLRKIGQAARRSLDYGGKLTNREAICAYYSQLKGVDVSWKKNKKWDGGQIGRRKKGCSALGFKHIPRQTGKWIDKEQYDKFYNSREWRELRYLALKNTDGRCECCGAAAKDGIQLHVDHIKPRASRPDLQLSLDNIQVLCLDCNIGKGAWDDTDWRQHLDDITKH